MCKHLNFLVFCHEFLLRLQIGITPPSFAADGVSWHATLDFGCELIGLSKIFRNREFSPILRQLSPLQGKRSLTCLCSISKNEFAYERINSSINNLQARGHYIDCSWRNSSHIQYSDRQASLPGIYWASALNSESIQTYTFPYLFQFVCWGRLSLYYNHNLYSRKKCCFTVNLKWT